MTLSKNWPDFRSISNFIKFTLPDPTPKYLLEQPDENQNLENTSEPPKLSECIILPISARNITDTLIQATSPIGVHHFNFAEDFRKYGHTLFVVLMKNDVGGDDVLLDAVPSASSSTKENTDNITKLHKLYEWLAHNQQLPTVATNNPKRISQSEDSNKFKDFILSDKREQGTQGRAFLFDHKLSLNRKQLKVINGKIKLPYNHFSNNLRIKLYKRHVDEIRERFENINLAKAHLNKFLVDKNSYFEENSAMLGEINHEVITSQLNKSWEDRNLPGSTNLPSSSLSSLLTSSEILMELNTEDRIDALSPFTNTDPNNLPEALANLIPPYHGPNLVEKARLVENGYIDSSPFNTSPQDNLKMVVGMRGEVSFRQVEFLTDEEEGEGGGLVGDGRGGNLQSQFGSMV